MGILNVTPDSFSDGGRFIDPSRALEQALKMQEEGADLIDIGAESSRPGSQPTSATEEVHRLLPVIQRIRPRLKIPLSVDTRKASVAEIMLKEGVDMVNDISAFCYDFRMAELVAQTGVPSVLMHMRGEPQTMQKEVRYINVVSEIIHFLKKQIEIAVSIGVDRGRILVDPGIGFGKLAEHNLEILRRLSEFRHLEAPVVVGASRKSFIRHLLGVEDPLHPAVQNGSQAVAAIAAMNGASLLRVHNVAPTRQVLKIVEALKSGR